MSEVQPERMIRRPDTDPYDRFYYEGDRGMFTFGELWGPFSCETENCDQTTYSIFITREDYEALPMPSGEEGFALHIVGQHIGQALCSAHQPERK